MRSWDYTSPTWLFCAFLREFEHTKEWKEKGFSWCCCRRKRRDKASSIKGVCNRRKIKIYINKIKIKGKEKGQTALSEFCRKEGKSLIIFFCFFTGFPLYIFTLVYAEIGNKTKSKM